MGVGRVRLLLTAAALLTLAACGKPAPGNHPAAVLVAQPLAQKVVDWDDFVGHFEAVEQVDVRPRVSGYLQKAAFRDGAYVRKGQTLFVIDPRPYQAAFDQAKAQTARAAANLANAEGELKRAEGLIAARAISQQELATRQAAAATARADVAAAEAAERTASLNLSFTRVSAPISGRVSDRRFAPGNLVNADQTVLTSIVTMDPIRFVFTGSEQIFLKYSREARSGLRPSSRKAANPVEIRLQDEPTYRWKGRMEFVDNALDLGSGTIRGRAIVKNSKDFLTPGLFGHMRLIGSGAYDALLLPEQAIVSDQTRQLVYVVGADHKVAQREVTTGPVIDGLRVIRSGISAQDTVIIEGASRTKTGAVVSPRPGKIVPPAPGATPAGDEAVSAPPSSSATPASARR